MSKTEAAAVAAADKLKAAQKAGDKKAEVVARQECINAYKELPDYYSALKCAKELLQLCKSMDDTKGQAAAMLAIGEMHYVMDNLQDALKHEEEAFSLFTKVGDRVGQDSAKEALDRVFNKTGKIEDAPNRQKGLAALAEMKRAIDTGDNTRFNEAIERCKRMDSVSDADIEDALSEQLESNYFKAAKMYKDVLQFENLLPEAKAVNVSDRIHYMAFRTSGGLHYGPAFQYVKTVTTCPTQRINMAPIVINEDREAWEHSVAYNHGIIDGMLQVPMSAGLVAWQNQLSEKARKGESMGYDSITN